MAFSPTVLDETGNSLSKCPFKYTGLVCFTPFSTEEFSAYTIKKPIPLPIHDVKVLLPGVACLASHHIDRQKAELQMNLAMLNHLSQMWHILGEPQRKSLLALYLNFLLNKDIHPSLEYHLLISGLCYLENNKIKSPYPIEDCLTYAIGDLANHYRTFKTFNLGGAVEFLFSVSALTTGITIIQSMNKETKIILKPQEYENQCSMGELPPVQPGNTCKLVKLVENHPAIDFIILHNPGGSTSKSLFFVQVSSRKYSERSIDSRYSSIHSTFQKSCFSDRTPSSVYSELYGCSLVEYVYATTSSVTTIKEQSVYVCQLDD